MTKCQFSREEETHLWLQIYDINPSFVDFKDQVDCFILMSNNQQSDFQQHPNWNTFTQDKHNSSFRILKWNVFHVIPMMEKCTVYTFISHNLHRKFLQYTWLLSWNNSYRQVSYSLRMNISPILLLPPALIFIAGILGYKVCQYQMWQEPWHALLA